MAGFAKIRDIVDYGDAGGQSHIGSFCKIPTLASSQTAVYDLAQAPGNPKQIYYDGPALTASLFGSTTGIWVGGNVSPAIKHLSKLSVIFPSATPVPVNLWMNDLLLCYPLIDLTVGVEQYLDNTITLPRYTDGRGVKAFLVSTSAWGAGAGQQFWIEYVDSNDVVRTQTHILNGGSTQATLIHTATGTAGLSNPFLVTPFGIKRVNYFRLTTTTTGFAALVLCNPITNIIVRESTAAVEKDFILHSPSLPVIKDGAHLQLIGAPNGSWAATTIMGEITTIWR